MSKLWDTGWQPHAFNELGLASFQAEGPHEGAEPQPFDPDGFMADCWLNDGGVEAFERMVASMLRSNFVTHPRGIVNPLVNPQAPIVPATWPRKVWVPLVPGQPRIPSFMTTELLLSTQAVFQVQNAATVMKRDVIENKLLTDRGRDVFCHFMTSLSAQINEHPEVTDLAPMVEDYDTLIAFVTSKLGGLLTKNIGVRDDRESDPGQAQGSDDKSVAGHATGFVHSLEDERLFCTLLVAQILRCMQPHVQLIPQSEARLQAAAAAIMRAFEDSQAGPKEVARQYLGVVGFFKSQYKALRSHAKSTHEKIAHHLFGAGQGVQKVNELLANV